MYDLRDNYSNPPGLNADPSQHQYEMESEKPRTSLLSILFWSIVLFGVLLLAFIAGVINSHKFRRKTPVPEWTKKTEKEDQNDEAGNEGWLTYFNKRGEDLNEVISLDEANDSAEKNEMIEEEDAELKLADRFSGLAQKYGLLEKPLNGQIQPDSEGDNQSEAVK